MTNTRTIILYPDNQPFCFSLSVQYPINDMKYSILSYKTGFVLDDFAPL